MVSASCTNHLGRLRVVRVILRPCSRGFLAGEESHDIGLGRRPLRTCGPNLRAAPRIWDLASSVGVQHPKQKPLSFPASIIFTDPVAILRNFYHHNLPELPRPSTPRHDQKMPSKNSET